MSYRDWSDDQESYFESLAWQHYENLETVPDLPPNIDEQARDLYEQAWMTFGEYSPEELQVMRDDFYDLIGISEEQFDWADWRDLYSEVNG